MLDAVITRDDVGRLQSVTVADVSLSNHHLLQWSVPLTARRGPSNSTVAEVERRRSSSSAVDVIAVSARRVAG